ncbi:hypothetical protein G6549_25675, partial [Bacillus sp. MM2020_1]|nr:hypothetical protein [Bacillus sp. MM2020_1]
DEYSNNNLINRIIKATIIKLSQVSASYENKKKLVVLKNYYLEVDERIFNIEDFNKVVLTRIYSSYKGIIEMSKMFWKDCLPDFYSGGVTTYNLLFDMNKIFELFIRQILKLYSNEILGETLEFKINKSSRYLLHDNKRNNYFRLIPDIVINDVLTKQTKLIIDTKWKMLNYSKRNFGISQEDIYQMYAYAREFSCPNIVILYPLLESNKATLPEFFNTTIKNKEIKISVHTIDLSYKLPSDVGEIIRQMKGIVQSTLGN